MRQTHWMQSQCRLPEVFRFRTTFSCISAERSCCSRTSLAKMNNSLFCTQYEATVSVPALGSNRLDRDNRRKVDQFVFTSSLPPRTTPFHRRSSARMMTTWRCGKRGSCQECRHDERNDLLRKSLHSGVVGNLPCLQRSIRRVVGRIVDPNRYF